MEYTPQQRQRDRLGETVVKALEKRHFSAWYVRTKEEALQKALELIPKTDTVSWGGSVTLDQLGMKDTLRKNGYTLMDRDAVAPEERMEFMRQCLLCDTFITSTNALTIDGQLVNIDGNGNRVAAMTFGPKSVIVFAGINKVVPDGDTALKRIHYVAAPMNAQRFDGLKTPCAIFGCCGGCTGESSMCSYVVTTRLCKPAGRIKVILIGEELGF